MKRMVLIPEEKLLRYEEQLNDQPPTNEQAGGIHIHKGLWSPYSLSWWELSWT